jgi:hypothetical protein
MVNRRGRKGDPLTPDREQAHESARLLQWIVSELNEEERTHFALELLDSTRHGGPESVGAVVESWFLTVLVRQHPEFEAQTKEYTNLRESGELYEGVDLGLTPTA